MYLDAIAKGGGGDITVESKTVTANGTVTAPSGKAYSPIIVDVPNSYTAGDNGKVVNNGQLVSQTAHAEVTENGTIDTTLNNSVVVNVQGSGSSPWTKLAEQDFTVSTTSRSETQVGSFLNLAASAVWTSAKMIYVRVRDKAGKRNGYFYGSDTFYSNPNPANGSTTALTAKVCIAYKVPDTGLTAIYVSAVGVYGSDISVSNNLAALNIKSKYGSDSSLTIDGTYHVEVYTLEWPDNVSPFA
jgi:hypothetical protein